MVKFRGIEVSIVSQIDCRRLPEMGRAFSVNPLGNSVACYVPISAGSQIWFEYSIDGPHPSGAAYFFKLLISGQEIVSWDCTAKHDYYGKTAYSLQPLQQDEFSMPAVVQKAFHFAIEDGEVPSWNNSYIEIRVYRVEHRRRIRELHISTPTPNLGLDVVQLVNVGLLEPGRPAHYYQYQLVDPQDEPYASFRFYCRTYDYLKRHNFLNVMWGAPTSSLSASSSEYFDLPEIQSATNLQPTEKLGSSPPLSLFKGQSIRKRNQLVAPYTLTNPSDESLNALTIDSIEDLPSAVPRSPQSKNSSNINFQQREVPPSPTRAPRHTRSKCDQDLTVDAHGANSSLEMGRRPLSPFTDGGLLRQFVGQVPLSARANLTEFGPPVDAELREQTYSESIKIQEAYAAEKSKTKAQRGGRALMNFLGRRTGRRTPT